MLSIIVLVVLYPILILSQRLTVFIHIGAHKTGSTHLQSFLVSNWKELEREKVCLPTHNHQAKDFSDILGDIRANNSHSEHLLKMRKCLEQEMNVVFSAEDLCGLQTHDIQNFKSLILSAAGEIDIQIKIILYYREWLNFIYSTYAELAKFYNAGAVSFPEFLLMKDDVLQASNSINFQKMITNYGSVFGKENMILVDFYGVEATGKDIAQVFVCDILKVMCKETSELNNKEHEEVGGVVKHENEKPNEVYLHYIYLFNSYLNNHLMEFCLRDYHTNAAYVNDLTKRSISFPSVISRMIFLRDNAVEQDREFHTEYGQIMLYGNHSANVEKVQAFQIEEVNIEQFSRNSTWQLFMKKEMLDFIAKGKVCSLEPDHHKIVFSQAKADAMMQ